MNITTAAATLKELGHPTRLRIYKRLVRAGHHGLPVGTLQQELSIPASTLSHHISALVSVGLIQQVRQGRTLCCISQFEHLDELISFLVEQCCRDQQEKESRPCLQ